ncbi:unnamed protein product [Leptidea sinapis]|uniref:Uncharacterized protein n=1 Tax=Leptidea sinapis TaxID=189913 RepID=A0A5E4QIJ6_9NEOP|nr:unnamed protein product [Leptidea sinapis]
MRSLSLIVASLALLVVCACAPSGESIQHIPPKQDTTPSATGRSGAESGAAVEDSGSKIVAAARERRDLGGLESDLLPSGQGVDDSAFGAQEFEGRSRIKVLPAYLG